MLERRVAENGVVYYASPLLGERGIPHALSTRVGGRSEAPFDALNLGNPNGCAVQDDLPRIAENYALLQAASGCGERSRCWVHQVHGAEVVEVRAGDGFDNGNVKADALVTDDPARVLSIRVADCTPVLIASDDGRVVGAAHAGWRGVIAGVVPATLRAMEKLRHVKMRDGFVAAIGPCIGFDAFEVGGEVIQAFERAFGADASFIRRRADGKGHVDLRQAIRRQLLDAGLAPEHIDMTDRCTVRDRNEFFSHRRDDGVTGRMAALIGASNA